METSEKLRAIFKSLSDKQLSPDAFHLRELLATKPCDPQDLSEREEWEYTIGTDKLKIVWQLEDTCDDLSIWINGEIVYTMLDWDFEKDTYREVADYDENAEELFKLIMDNGGVLIETD